MSVLKERADFVALLGDSGVNERVTRLLLVEDEARMAEAIRRVLVAEHYTVDVSADGEGGLAYLDQHHYDVVILDRLLPGISGDEVLGQMRANGMTTPVLMLTALSALEGAGFG